MNQASEILLIDDDTSLTTALSHYLTQHHYKVHLATDGKMGIKRALNQTFHAIITEINLPACHGFDVLQAIRTHSKLPIIFLTGREDMVDALLALQLGADDYLTKPCNATELLLRLRAVLRRYLTEPNLPTPVIKYHSIELDCSKRSATLNGKSMDLTNTEFNILAILMKSPGQAFSKEELTEFALARKFTAYDRSIDVHIGHLREKLGHAPQGEPWIKTLRGFGYKLNQLLP